MPPVPKRKGPKTGRNSNLVIALAVAGVLAAALIAGSLLLTRGNGAATAPATTEAGGGAAGPVALVAGIPQKGTVLGNPRARVRLLQFEDLQCPGCRSYTAGALPGIIDEYVRPGRVKLDFRGIAFLGPDSLKLLRIAVAAGFQNKLWQVVGLIYENQGQENSGWATDAVIDGILAKVEGLDVAKVKADAASAAVTKEIATVEAESTKFQVRGTPSLFIGIGVNKPYEIQVGLTAADVRAALNDALNG
jgi:protein-disulfide isomerase